MPHPKKRYSDFPTNPPPNFIDFVHGNSESNLTAAQMDRVIEFWSRVPEDKKKEVWDKLHESWRAFDALRKSVQIHAPEMAHGCEFKAAEFLELLHLAADRK